MISRPVSSRARLIATTFEQKENGSWFFSVGGSNASFYTELFSQLHSDIMSKSNTGWRISKSGKARYAFFPNLDVDERETIQNFQSDYRVMPVLELNDNIRPFFTDELDACLALDLNKERPEAAERTCAGELEYEAKYEKDEDAINELSKLLANALTRVPPRCDADQCCLTYIPPTKDKAFHLPKILAEKVAAILKDGFHDFDTCALVHAQLTVPKSSLKNLSLEEKVEVWEHIVENKSVELTQSVEDCAVYVIDDLYQSGVTMWSFAKYLKSVGAAAVLGCVAVKSLRDTDNQ